MISDLTVTRRRSGGALLAVLLTIVSSLVALGQTLYDRPLNPAEIAALASPVAGKYSVRNFQLSHFGGSSSGGSYELQGGAGQGATSPLGGNFALKPGFWSTSSIVQMRGLPVISISLLEGKPVLSWVGPAGLILEETGEVSRGWTASAETLESTGGKTRARINITAGRRFFRLRQTAREP